MERMHLKRLSEPKNWQSPFSSPVFLNPIKIDVSPHAVLKRLGRGVDAGKWLAPVEHVCAEFTPGIRPRGMYRLAFCRPNGLAIEVGKDHLFTSDFLKMNLPNPAVAAVFLVTIGSNLEEDIKESTARKNNRSAFILDCLGSNAAESTAAAIHREVEKHTGLSMRRYSPGYNDWNIGEQEILFDFLGRDNGKNLGVNLSSDYMMSPRKSVSGIILPRIEHSPRSFPKRMVSKSSRWTS